MLFRISEPTMSQTYAPCIIVEYYRYTRFWPNGIVTMHTNTKRFNKAYLLKLFY